MTKGILKVVKPYTNNIEECDGRNLNGIAISIRYEDEVEKEAPANFWDFATVTIQDVRWDGSRNRNERDVYIVSHIGDTYKH